MYMCPGRPEENVGSSGAGVTVSCESPDISSGGIELRSSVTPVHGLDY